MQTNVILRKRTAKCSSISQTPNKEVPKKRFSLSYSRSTHDDRDFKFHQFHNFWNIVMSEKKVGIEEARRRVYQTRHNTFRYRPSKEYIQFIDRLKAMRIIAVA